MVHKNDTFKKLTVNRLYVSVLIFCTALGYAIGISSPTQSCKTCQTKQICQCDEDCKCCASCSCKHGEK